MIASISGTIEEIGTTFVVVNANGVGYLINVSERHIASLPRLGERVSVYTKQIVRENEISLYGFESAGERRLFDLLLTVNGMGPKHALNLIGVLGEEGVATAILKGDTKALVRTPGIGNKLAERMKIELAEKIREETLLGKIGKQTEAYSDDIVEALVSLGHKRTEAERAAKAARAETDESNPEVLLPLALKHASKKS